MLCEYGDVGEVKFLLDNGVNPNCTYIGEEECEDVFFVCCVFLVSGRMRCSFTALLYNVNTPSPFDMRNDMILKLNQSLF